MKMALTLRYLSGVNSDQEQEYREWVEKRLAFLPNEHLAPVKKAPNAAFSILKHPKLWSGARPFETRITPLRVGGPLYPEPEPIAPIQEALDTTLDSAKQLYGNNPEKLAAIEKFEKDHPKFLKLLQERALRQAIHHTLDLIDPFNPTVIALKNLSSPHTLVKLRTRGDCLEAHAKAVALSEYLEKRSVLSETQRFALRQATILSKRLFDGYYQDVKKQTKNERLFSNTATLSCSIGLAVGVAAVAFYLLSFAFPPLLLPATICGYIGLVAYVSTIISAGNMSYEAIGYNRSPSYSEIKTFAIDIILAPMNIIGTTIVAAIDKGMGHIKKFFQMGSTFWNFIGSNLFPDIFETKTLLQDTFAISLPTKTKVEHSVSAGTWRNLTSYLLSYMDAGSVQEVKYNTKKQVKQQSKETAKHDQDFAYVKLSRLMLSGSSSAPLATTKSYHAHILSWNCGFFSQSVSNAIKRAHKNYEKLDADCSIGSRLAKLNAIKNACEYALLNQNPKKETAVTELDKLVRKEMEALNGFGIEEDKVMLVGV